MKHGGKKMWPCELCRLHRAFYTMQYMDGPDKPPICIALGSHYRGHKFIRVCWECGIKAKAQAIIT
jgi:hypothetical protein